MQKKSDTSGSTEEFVRLLRVHDRRLAAYVHSLAPCWADAQDILQETSVRLWEQFDRYEPETDFGAWACTVARYLVMAHWERSGRDKHHFLGKDLIESIGQEVERAAGSGEAEQRLSMLAECVKELSPSNRKILSSRYSEQESIESVAAELGKTANAIYISLTRLRKWLHGCIEKRLAEESVT